MQTVDQMINDILRREGGYVDHPADRGGPTKYGITLQTYAAWIGIPITFQDLQRMSLETAATIYRMEYYLKPGISQLPEEIQPFVFDCSVNHGPAQAIKFVQEACNKFKSHQIKVDGICGPATVHAADYVQVIHKEEFLWLLIEKRRQFYIEICADDPTQEVFLVGWMNRLKEFEPKREQPAPMGRSLVAKLHADADALRKWFA